MLVVAAFQTSRERLLICMEHVVPDQLYTFTQNAA